MGNIYAVTNNEGYNCIRIAKTTSALELKDLCKTIGDTLVEQGYPHASVHISICDLFVVMDIEMLAEDCDVIGTVEFMTDEDVSTEYYELLPIRTSPQSKEWTKPAWETYSNKVLNLLNLLSFLLCGASISIFSFS